MKLVIIFIFLQWPQQQSISNEINHKLLQNEFLMWHIPQEITASEYWYIIGNIVG